MFIGSNLTHGGRGGAGQLVKPCLRIQETKGVRDKLLKIRGCRSQRNTVSSELHSFNAGSTFDQEMAAAEAATSGKRHPGQIPILRNQDPASRAGGSPKASDSQASHEEVPRH